MVNTFTLVRFNIHFCVIAVAVILRGAALSADVLPGTTVTSEEMLLSEFLAGANAEQVVDDVTPFTGMGDHLPFWVNEHAASGDFGNGDMATLSTAPPAPPLIRDFQGSPYTGSSPPDTHGAVGPDHIVVVVNRRVRHLYKESGQGHNAGDLIANISLASFFASVGANNPFDPRALFDTDSGRY